MAQLKSTVVQGNLSVTDDSYLNGQTILGGHLILPGVASGSTANTTQIIFKSGSTEYGAISATTSNQIVLNPSSSSTTGQIILTPNGTSKFTKDTDSSSTSTGALVVSGGLGVGKKLYGTSAVFSGTVTITNATDSAGTSANAVALIVGGAQTATHLELDGNEIMAKSDGTTPTGLSLNYDGGDITLGVNNTTYKVNVRSTMASTSKTTGALIVGGGVGIGGIVHTGANLYTQGSVIAGTFTANTAQSAEIDVIAQSGAGTIYLYSTAATTGNRGIYALNAAGNGASIMLLDQSNNTIFDQNVYYDSGQIVIRHGTSPMSRILFGTRAQTNTYTMAAQNEWGDIFYLAPAKNNSANTWFDAGFIFRQYSYTASSTTRLSYYEDYYFPRVTTGLSSSPAYNVLTSKGFTGISTSWHKGRDNAQFKMTSINGYSPAISIKTTNGSWDVGTYSNASYDNYLLFSYIADTLYSGTTASYYGQIRFQPDGGIIAAQTAGTENHFIARATGYSNSATLDVKLMVGSGKTNHGVYSTGYSADGAAFTSDGKWMVYRNSSGDIILNGNAQNVTGTVAIGHGGTGATTAAGARANLGTWSLVSDSYNTLMPADGTSNHWIKIGTANTSYGILPSQSGVAGSGHNYIGTSTWYWKYAYVDEIYGHLIGKSDTTDKLNNAGTAGPQIKLPADNTTFSFLTSSNGAANVRANAICLSTSYSNGDLTNYKLDVYSGHARIYAGNLTITRPNHSLDVGVFVENTDTTNPLKLGYIIGNSGNGGIYDFTHSVWKVQIAADGTTNFNGTATTATTFYTANPTSSTANDIKDAIQTYWNNNKSTIPRGKGLALYSSHSGAAMNFGYFIPGYDTTPYGGFFSAYYNTPYYLGIHSGTFKLQTIFTTATCVILKWTATYTLTSGANIQLNKSHFTYKSTSKLAATSLPNYKPVALVRMATGSQKVYVYNYWIQHLDYNANSGDSVLGLKNTTTDTVSNATATLFILYVYSTEQLPFYDTNDSTT